MSRTLGSVMLAVSVSLCCAGAQAPGAQPNSFFAGPGTQGAFLNGQALLPGTSILAGESVTTGSGGVAVLTPTHGAGGVLELGPNAQATVGSGNYNSAKGGDQVQMQQGSALVSGTVAVSTAQGQTFQSQTPQTSFVVNSGGSSSTMGVLTGTVRTSSPATTPSVISAGDAIQVTGSGGDTQLSHVPLNRVQRPSTSAAVPQPPPASQSQ